MKENDIIKDRYQLLRPLGSGGFGEVWLAKDKMTGTNCALKFYVRLDDAGRSEFRNEYSRMLGISHPNLLTAKYYDEWEGRPFLVMDYCGGGAASSKVGQLGETELWRLIRDVASGLACLHSQRNVQGKEAPVIHQDIKPANFLQKEDGTWLVSDFGISSRMRSSMSSQSGREVSSGGTIPYMGPERFGQDRMLVKASDIWALGASVYEMATKAMPFDEYGGILQKKGEEIPHLPIERWSSDLDRLVSSCLQKETWNRPTAALVADYADCKLEGKPLPKLPHEAPKPKSKLWKWMAVAGSIVAVVLAIVLWPKSPIDHEPLIDPDTQAYEACETVNDYRAYMSDYGRNALHYANAKAFVDQYLVDSIKQAQEAQASADAAQQAEDEARAKAEAEKKEDDAYKKCTTIAACNSYLKTHPNGRYVEEVKAKKAELEAKAAQTSLTGTTDGHEWVDLGLPSGTLWATCNVGASKPEDFGNYYAWGETQTKGIYDWESYRYSAGTSNQDPRLTKYCGKSEFGNNGFTDNMTTLQSSDDPATAIWGGGWHMPSKPQWDELLANTRTQWTNKNGVEGCLLTSKKNGAMLFLPATGYREGSGLYETDTGCYWSRSLSNGVPYPPSASWDCGLNSYCCQMYEHLRYLGQCVRPVREK